MPHVLATLKNVPLEIIKGILEKDKAFDDSQGMCLEQIWQNSDDQNKVFFLFKINDIEHTKALIHKLHSKALAEDPKANLPKMNYLK
jgi:hypothetical protein